jgi:Family of unknown function (DUF6527)
MLFHTLIRQILIWLRLIPKVDLAAQIVPTHPNPEEIKSGKMLIVGGASYQKWACFQCPGGCGESVLLSLNQSQHPRWKVSLDWIGRPTVYPSVKQLNECRCHFWIKKGKIEWCPDSNH